MTKAKAKRTEPGVYLRRDGRPRYEVKVRWTDAVGVKRYLPTVIFPFDPSAKNGPTSEAIALASANRHAITERTALQLHDKPRAELAEAWTLGGLLTRLKDESQATIDALTSEGKAIPKYLQKNVSTARMLLGQSKPEDTANHRGFPDLCALPLPEKTIHGYLTLLGHAMICRFEHQYDSAFAVLGRASTYIGERRSEKSREWYLNYAMKAAAFPIALGILLVLLRQQAAALLTMDGFDVALATCAGSIGAVFSIIWRTGNIDFDRFAAKKLHRIEAYSRIVAGCISGLLAGLAIRSQLLFGSWASGPHPILTMLTVAVAAGTGERLASSIIDHVHAGVSAKKGKPSSHDQSNPGEDNTSSNHNHSTT